MRWLRLARKMDSIEVDRTKVKPVVKITGEFWAQITEGDGNFHMFDFLEREGAQVLVEPIATWVAYLMYQAKAHAMAKWPVNRPHRNPEWYEVKKTSGKLISACTRNCGALAPARRCGITSTTARSRIMGGITHHLGAADRVGRDGASLLQPVRARRRRTP